MESDLKLISSHCQAQTYQVTEEQATNDLTIVDPFTGSQKLYAPDPDPSLPSKRLPIEVNPLSTPSNGQRLPLDVIKYDLLENNELAAKLQEHIKKQQGLLQDNPTVNRGATDEKLKIYSVEEILLKLRRRYLRVSLSFQPYNPTFLITQSNNLLEQYQNQQQGVGPVVQLFKPEPNSYEQDQVKN